MRSAIPSAASSASRIAGPKGAPSAACTASFVLGTETSVSMSWTTVSHSSSRYDSIAAPIPFCRTSAMPSTFLAHTAPLGLPAKLSGPLSHVLSTCLRSTRNARFFVRRPRLSARRCSKRRKNRPLLPSCVASSFSNRSLPRDIGPFPSTKDRRDIPRMRQEQARRPG